MAKLTKAEHLTRYKNRLKHAKRYRQEKGYDATWHRLLDLYAGKHFPSGMQDEDRIAINMAFSTINVIFPALTVNHPKIEVLANKADDEDRAVISEAVINYWWKHYDFRSPFRRAAKDFLTLGHGWIKVGYKFEEKDKPLQQQEKQNQLLQLNSQVDSFAGNNPNLAAHLPTQDEIAANAPETKTVIVHDRPTLERISPFDMFIDPEATCMEDARWICQQIVRPLEDVQDDKRYKAKTRSACKADAVISSDWLSHDQKRKMDSDIDRVTVYEFYDLIDETMCVFCEGSSDYLIDPKPMPYSFGHPYEFIANYEVPDEFYPIGDLEMIEAPQQELNKTRSQMMNHRKKYGRKYLYRASALGPEGRQGLESSDDNIAIEVVDDNIPLQDVIIPVPITPMSSDLYQYSQIIQGDMDKVSGVNEYARGSTPEMKRTATEAAMIQDGANARSADKLAVVEIAIGAIAMKVLKLAQQYMTSEDAARITGSDGQQFWFHYDFQDIDGEFDFQVEAGSTQPQNETNRRQQAVAMMNSLGPFIGSVIDPQALVKHVLQFGFGVKSPGKFMAPPPAPPQMDANGQPVDPNAPPPPAGANHPTAPPMGGPQGPPQGQMPMGGQVPPPGVGVDAPQMNPQDLLAAQNAGGMDMAGLTKLGQGGLPPELVKQLQNQMGLGR